jgi:PAS domain S-box-containing protein
MPSRKRSREEIRRDAPSIAHSNGPGPDPNALLHEVHVHQEELNARNDELRRLRAALESATHGYADLYDLAPNGYLTLDAHGVIRQLNLAAASLIGSSRQAIQDRPLLVFVVQSDRGRLLEFLRHCRQQSEGACIAEELALAARGDPRQVQLLCRARQDERGRREYLTAMLDVTQLRRLEAERHDAASERAALAGRLIAVQEDMRKRFSRDLHDNIGQQMSALGLKLAALVAGAPDHSWTKSRSAVTMPASRTAGRSSVARKSSCRSSSWSAA